jgi:Fe-S cluster assembly protein SufD
MSDTAVLDEVMESTTAQENSVRAPILSGLPADRNADLPEWFRTRQQEAWARFGSLPMPNRKEQAWRFSNVNALDLAPFSFNGGPAHELRREILDRSTCLDEVTARMIFADDRLLRRDPLPEKLRQLGVIFQPLERALIEHEELFRQHFMAQPVELGSAKFAALHEALVTSGTFIYVPRGVEVELPIEIFHWLDAEDAAVFPHTLLVADELSKVTVIEHFRSTNRDRRGFSCGVNDLIAARGAKLTYVCVQDWSESSVAVQVNSTTVSRDASAMSLNVNLGAAYSRFESFSRINGEAGRSDLLAVSVGDEKQEFDARTLQDHASPHTTSDLLYKNALTDHARATFGGLIRVEPHAHFTDAYQTVRNLLLTEDAEANSMPGLEIMADNVKCSHGATSGQINEDELFYLLARGIPKNAAQRLLVVGFLDEVVQRLNNGSIATKIHDMIEAKFVRSRRS